jgi:methionine-rich copper-binding protein CopC
MLSTSALAVIQTAGHQRGVSSRPVGNKSGTAMPMSVNQTYQHDCATRPTIPRPGASASRT